MNGISTCGKRGLISLWVSLRSTHPTRANDDRLNTVAEKMAVNVLSRAAP